MSQFPKDLWPIVNSTSNLTPRGQKSFFSGSSASPTQEFSHKIHIWNGHECGSLARALALTKGNELELFLSKAQDSILNALFGGGVIRGVKLQRGSVFTFDDQKEFALTPLDQIEAASQAYERCKFMHQIFPVSSLLSKIGEKKF